MKRVTIVISVFLLIAFALLSKYEDRGFLRNLDFAVTVKVQERIDKSTHLRLADFVGNVMEGATFFAAPVFSTVAMLVLSGFALRKNRRALFIPILFAIIVLVELYGKTIVHHPSPPFSMIKHPTSLFPANYVNEQFSYPSGHAARAVFLAIIAYMLTRKRWFISFGLLLYVAFVSISRIYLGEHWFTDVVGGLLLGSALGVLTWASLATYNR